MSRPASKYTATIRKLVTKNPDLTHKDARAALKAAGLPVVAKAPQKSAEFSKVEKEYDIGSPVKPDLEKVEGACIALKYDEKTTKSVINEAAMRGAWAYEANTFNVTKFNWLKTQKSAQRSSSRKPTTSKNSKAKTAKSTGARTRRPKVVVADAADTADSLSVIEKLGGIQAAEAKMEALKVELTSLEAAVTAVKALSARIQKAA